MKRSATGDQQPSRNLPKFATETVSGPLQKLGKFTCKAIASQRREASGMGRLRRGPCYYTIPACPVAMGCSMNSRGSVILPVTALAATVNGEARYTPAFR